MKKSFKTLTLGLLTIGMLAGCGQKPAPTWSSEDAKTMSDNLYGVVLPFVSLENPEVKFDSENDQVVVTGGELESTAIASYAQKFTVADGWTDITPENAAYYAFEKQALNDKGAKRWVAVQFGNEEYEPASSGDNTGPLQADGDEPAGGEGQGEAAKATRFAIYATDPYDYEFPLEDLQKAIKKMCGEENVNLPVFQADRYENVYYTSESDGKEYLYYSFAFADSTCEATYKAQFEDAQYGFTVAANSQGGYDAYNRSQGFVVHFEYSSKDGGMYVEINNYLGWPDLAIEDQLKLILPENPKDARALPEYEQGFDAVFCNYDKDDKTVSLEIIYTVAEGVTPDRTTMEAAKANYATTLAKTFHAATVKGQDVLSSPNSEFTVSFDDYSAYEGLIPGFNVFDRFMAVCSAAPEDDTAWPAAKISAYFSAKGFEKTGLPACEIAASSFRFETYAAGEGGDERCEITLYNAITDEVTGFDSYKAVLEAAGYVASSSSTATSCYLNPNGRPDHSVQLLISGKNIRVLVFPLEVYNEFPMARVLQELHVEAADAPYPAFTVENARWYQFNVRFDDENGIVKAEFATEEAATAGFNAIYSAFAAAAQAGSEENPLDWFEADTNYFMTNDTTFKVYMYKADGETSFSVQFIHTLYLTSFPSGAMIFSRSGYVYRDAYASYVPAPEFSADLYVINTVSYNNGYVGTQITMTFADAATAEANLASYVATLVENRYQDYMSSYGFCYRSPFRVYLETSGNKLTIEFYA